MIHRLSMETSTQAIPTTVTPASTVLNLFLNEINQQDIHELSHVQNTVLEQLDKSNERLDGLNKLSAARYSDATKQFDKHTQMLTTMKTDLDTIFKRIKYLKTQLSQKYPAAYHSAIQMNPYPTDPCNDDDDDEEEEGEDRFGTDLKPLNSSSLVKSKTGDCSQFSASSAMRETYSLAEINSIPAEPSPRSFDAVRRFVFENSASGGQDLTSLFRTARQELRKLNEGFLGGSQPKSNKSTKD